MKTPLLLQGVLLLAASGCRTPGAAPAEVPPAPAVPMAAAPEVRLRFEGGDVRRCRSLVETVMEVRAGDQRMGARSSEEIELTHRVAGPAPDGNGVVVVTVDASAITYEIPSAKRTYTIDTRRPETVAAWKELCRTDPRAHMLDPLVERVGKALVIGIRPDGRILDAKNARGTPPSYEVFGEVVGIPLVLQVLGSVDRLPGGPVAVGGGGPYDLTYDWPSGRHSTKGNRMVTAWDPATGEATVATEAKILFYPALDENGGRCGEPTCPGMPAGFRLTDWSVRAEETLDLARGILLRSRSIHTIVGGADSPVSGRPAPAFTMEMKFTFEVLP